MSEVKPQEKASPPLLRMELLQFLSDSSNERVRYVVDLLKRIIEGDVYI